MWLTGDAQPCCFWAPASPSARQAGPAAMGVADREWEQQDSELSSRWLGRLEASLLGSVGLTGWSWKNDKCLLRASSEWPDHKPQDWTRAALLCLGLGPELSAESVRLRAGPQRSHRRLAGQPALGKEYLGPGRALLAKKDSRPVRQGLWEPICAHHIPTPPWPHNHITEEQGIYAASVIFFQNILHLPLSKLFY